MTSNMNFRLRKNNFFFCVCVWRHSSALKESNRESERYSLNRLTSVQNWVKQWLNVIFTDELPFSWSAKNSKYFCYRRKKTVASRNNKWISIREYMSMYGLILSVIYALPYVLIKIAVTEQIFIHGRYFNRCCIAT